MKQGPYVFPMSHNTCRQQALHFTFTDSTQETNGGTDIWDNGKCTRAGHSHTWLDSTMSPCTLAYWY